MRRRLLLLALVMAVPVAGLARELSAQEKDPLTRRLAILVGVEAYLHPSLREPEPLQYPIEDVTELARVLRQQGYEVVLLTDDTGRDDDSLRPTKANIDAHLRTVLRRCGAGDTVVLAFAGHGVQFSGEQDAYFCPVDARPFSDEADSLVSITQVYSELEKSFAGVKVILIDACRNDPTPGRGRGLDADAAPAPPKGVAALFSCSAGQKAYEHDELKHGVFFHHVLAGLQGKAANTRDEVTFERLSAYVRDSVPETLSRLFPGHEQLPNMKADLVGRPPVLAKVEPAPEASLPEPTPTPTPTPLPVATDPSLLEPRVTNSIGMPLVLIPAGEFRMGVANESYSFTRSSSTNNTPQHRVRLTRPFYLGEHEVTHAEWQAVLTDNPSAASQRIQLISGQMASQGGDFEFGLALASLSDEEAGELQRRIEGSVVARFPVESVNWYLAAFYCNELSNKEQLAPYYKITVVKATETTPRRIDVEILGGNGYRLPTEAEWEHASGSGPSGSAARYQPSQPKPPENAKAPRKTKVDLILGGLPTAVATGEPNGFGLFDMLGNVQEWCGDWYLADAYKKRARAATDPFVRSATEQTYRVVRGKDNSTYRIGYRPGAAVPEVGFRVARTP